jgi:D-alanine--D-alanine ligase
LREVIFSGEMTMNVALIFGGRGLERDVSIAGARFVYPLIPREKYRVIPILITADGQWLIREDDGCPCGGIGLFEAEDRDRAIPTDEDFTLPCTPMNFGDRQGLIFYGGFIPIDCAFPLLHGDFGEDGVVQGALENAMIKYVGEDTVTSATCLDKRLTHLIAARLGIPVARSIFADPNESCDTARDRAERLLGYPLFLKPSDLGSSVGASPVRCAPHFERAYREATRLSSRGLIIEELVDIDCELEIGVLVDKSKLIFTNIGEIRADSGFYDYKEKYGEGSPAVVSAEAHIEESVAAELKRYAKKLCQFMGIRSLCRIDFFRTKKGEILFNEINTMPGFTGASLYPRMMAGVGYPPEKLLDALISEALL